MDAKKEDIITLDLTGYNETNYSNMAQDYEIGTISISDLNLNGTTISDNTYTLPNITIGGSDTIYTTGVNWGSFNPNTSGKISLTGDDADIEINGASLKAVLQGIEERLNILRPNKQLEAEWDQLRELGEQYRALEAKLLEQTKMWETLKAMPPPEVK